MANNVPVVGWFTELLMTTGSVEISIFILLLAAVALAVAVHWLLFRVVHHVVSRSGPVRPILKGIRGPTRLAAILLALVVVLPAADFDPAIADVLRKFMSIGMTILLGWSAIIAIDALTDWVVRRHRLDVDDNLAARRVHTQARILERIAIVIVVLLTTGSVLFAFPSVQAYGVSLFASAGVAGLVLGFAARPVLSNIIAGIQIALTQPIRIDDVVIVEGEWGWIEEITTTYVVVRIWDQRRLVVPLSHFIEKPFENWTRESAQIVGSVTWHLDYRVPIDAMRGKLDELLAGTDLWDGKVANLQVTDSGPSTITVRALMSAGTSPKAWDLRCDIREKMIAWLRAEHPEALPRTRATLSGGPDVSGSSSVSSPNADAQDGTRQTDHHARAGERRRA
jgi:small-conductance mechanosensitive channel